VDAVTRFFDAPHLIRTEEDLERFLEELSRHDMLEYIRQQRPDTKWVVHLLTNVTFYVNKLLDHPVPQFSSFDISQNKTKRQVDLKGCDLLSKDPAYHLWKSGRSS
jgi:hypothetical protein